MTKYLYRSTEGLLLRSPATATHLHEVWVPEDHAWSTYADIGRDWMLHSRTVKPEDVDREAAAAPTCWGPPAT